MRVGKRRPRSGGLGPLLTPPGIAGPVLMLALFLPTHGRIAAQVPEDSSDPGLQDQALRFAQAWVNAQVDRLEAMLEPSGVRLQLKSDRSLTVPPSQAQAAIASFMRRYSGGEAELFRISPVGGDTSSGFAEFHWACGVAGLQAPAEFTLFVAFSRGASGWIVTEIRVLP